MLKQPLCEQVDRCVMPSRSFFPRERLRKISPLGHDMSYKACDIMYRSLLRKHPAQFVHHQQEVSASTQRRRHVGKQGINSNECAKPCL